MTTSKLESYANSSINLNNSSTRRRSKQLINRNNNNNIINNTNNHYLNSLNDWKPIRGGGNRVRGRGRRRYFGSGDFGFGSRVEGGQFNGYNYYNQQNASFYRNSYPNLTGLEVTVMTSDFFSQVRLPYSEVIKTLNLFFRPNNQDDQRPNPAM